MKDYYVYLHKFSNGTFYVGKGKDKRVMALRRKGSSYWLNLYSKYGEPLKGVYRDGLTETEAFALETTLIKLLRHAGIPICNLTDGGEGISGYTHTQETKDKMRQSKVGKPNNSCQDYIKTQDTHPASVAVLCLTTGEEFKSVTEACRAYSLDPSAVTKVCRGKRKTVKSYKFVYKI